MTDSVLTIEDLHLSFPIYRGEVHALNHVSLEIKRGEIVGVVGESGSGSQLPPCSPCACCRKAATEFITVR